MEALLKYWCRRVAEEGEVLIDAVNVIIKDNTIKYYSFSFIWGLLFSRFGGSFVSWAGLVIVALHISSGNSR